MNYTFDMFSDDINNIVKQIKEDKFEPFTVIGITRGGLIPATMLAHALNIKNVEALNFNDDLKLNPIFRVINKYNLEVLVVDDIVDTGDTFLKVKKLFPNCKYTSLIYNRGQILGEPDFYGRTIDKTLDPSWITFWWENE